MSKSPTPESATGPRQTTRVGAELRSGVTELPLGSGAQYASGDIIAERYELVKEIGHGGMGVVWVARSLVLKVDVALKLIRSAETGAEAASRMAREANAAARVNHPALVRVYDFGWTQHGDPFLVMELIRGESLSDSILRRKRIEARRAVQLLLPIADGLRLAHANSVVHRDIKPGNILIAEEGTNRLQPKLLDFGIAKVGHSTDGKLTQQGVVLGSPEYMSPEQALGLEQVDARSDVWSLAIALYEMVSGAVPFARPNYNALMQAIIHAKPPPLSVSLDEPAFSLWPIVAKALEKRPENRWSGMDEFGAALAAWLWSQGVEEDLAGNSLRAVWLREGTNPLASLPPPSQEVLVEPMTLPPASDTSETLRRAVSRRWLAFIGGVAVAALIASVVISQSGDDGASAAAPDHAASAAAAVTAAPLGSGEAANVASSAAVDPQDLPLLQGDARRRSGKSAPAKPPTTTKKKARRDFGF